MPKITPIPGGKPHHPIAMKLVDDEFVCPQCGAVAKSGFFGELQEEITCYGNETVMGDAGH